MTVETLQFDHELALKRVINKPAIAKEIFTMLIETLDEDRKAILDAFQKQEIAVLKGLVHKLHGGLCYTGLPKLEAAARKLDKDLVTGKTADLEHSIQALSGLVDDVLAETDQVMRLLEM